MTRPHPPLLLLGSWALVVGVLVGLAAPSAGQRASWDAEADRATSSITSRELRAVVEFLASDALQGRATGHPGSEVARRYLASMFRTIGIDPAGRADDYTEALDLLTPALGARNALVVQEGSNGSTVTTRHAAGVDVQPVAASPSGEVTGPLAFASYGVHDPRSGIDDYAGLDVRRRIVVVFDRPSAMSRAWRVSLHDRAVAAKARGAIGLLVVAESGDRKLRDLAQVYPTEPSPRDRKFFLETDVLPLPAARVSGALAKSLLSMPGRDVSLDALRDGADQTAGSTTTGVFLVPGRVVTLSVDVAHSKTQAFNVLGVVRGTSQPAEAVVVGAHLDHDGLDAEGRIYNGADDNASGTAGVLEIAQAFAVAASLGSRPRRSVVFALWDGEERGLLGSRAFVARPRPDGVRIVANLNMDMIGRNEDPEKDARPGGSLPPAVRAMESTNSLHLIGYTLAPALAVIARQENAAVGLRLKTMLDDTPQDLVRRSDHWAFLERGVPALFFFTGLHSDYHTPQDDAERLNYEKMERIVRLVYRVAWRVANAPAPPGFVDPAPSATR